MSFDVFVACYEAGRPLGNDGDVFQRIFGRYESERSEFFRRLRFTEDAGADVYIGAGGGCMFNHFGGPRFFDCLFEYLQQSRGAACWPGDQCGAAVAEEGVLSELPPDMIESLRSVVVRSGAELMRTILA